MAMKRHMKSKTEYGALLTTAVAVAATAAALSTTALAPTAAHDHGAAAPHALAFDARAEEF